ncbi:hypothetical protein ACF0H5_021706 [Mactra antiquata]
MHAFYCSSWPREASNTFLYNQTARYRPSDQLVQDILQSRCFVVPKGISDGQYSDIEWRLSFSCAERLLMFDLNCVHIRCYVLLKYDKTTFLNNIPNCKGIVSSNVCKTVLFHPLSQTPKTNWIEEELIENLTKCLQTLKKLIDEENYSHFIMPKNNLLANRLEMAQYKKDGREFSLKINKILNNEGVNEDVIRKRRKCYSQMECNERIHKYTDYSFSEKPHFFGSQSEGSTTLGLHSDLDSVMIPDNMVVITSSLDKIPEDMIYTFKMDKYTKNGYCLLRDISFNNSYKCSLYGWSYFRKYHQLNSCHRYLKNTFRFLSDWHGTKIQLEGPAIYFRTASDEDINFLHAFYCSSWPREASNTFLYNQTARY